MVELRDKFRRGKLRKFCKANGLSLSFVAARLNVPESTLRSWDDKGLSDAAYASITNVVKSLLKSLTKWNEPSTLPARRK